MSTPSTPCIAINGSLQLPGGRLRSCVCLFAAVFVCACVFVCLQLCCVADVDIPNQFDHTIVLGDLNYRLQAPREYPVSTP